MRLKTYKMAISILPKFLTLKWNISRTIWRIEVGNGSSFCIFHALSFEFNFFFDQRCLLKNAFGKVHHELIRAVLRFHHIPRSIEKFILHLYNGFHISVATNDFLTDPIPVQREFYKETAFHL